MSNPPRYKIQGSLPRYRVLTAKSRIPGTAGNIKPSTKKPNIIITEIKTIKPAEPKICKTPEQKVSKTPEKIVKEKGEEDLREQLQKEIEARSRWCAHRLYECTEPVLAGRKYCTRHVLDDPDAPFRQCVQILGPNQRCPMPAPIPSPSDNRREQGLCFEHAREAIHNRQRNAAPPPPVTTTETLLLQLQHYVRPERARTVSCTSSVSVVSEPSEQDQPGVPNAVDPFKQIDAVAVNAAVSTAIMECASASDSDADSLTLGEGGNCRGGHDEAESDAEETEYDYHPLRFAGIFTAEEAVSEAKTALTLLHSAYLRQMERLKVLLLDARFQYVKNLKAEKEQYCSINTQACSGPLTVRERRQLRKLKAYASFHTKHGADALLARKLSMKRAKLTDPHPNRVASQHRCIFSEGGVRCECKVLPASKYCMKHVLDDAQQVLFVPCADERGTESCREPIARLPLPTLACRYHTDPPVYTTFSLKKEESDSEVETQTAISDYSREDAVDSKESIIEEKHDLLDFPLSADMSYESMERGKKLF